MASASIIAAILLQAAAPAIEPQPELVSLSDPELAAVTGKFLLPNGIEIALSVTSDSFVDGRAVLRTNFTIDRTASVSVFGRTSDSGEPAARTGMVTSSGTGTTVNTGQGVAVIFDRASHTQQITPTFAVGNAANVTTGTGTETSPAALGLSPLDVQPGVGVPTADGIVTLTALPRGTQVDLAGNGLAIANLVGQSIATAVINSANNRTIDTVTNVNIDLRSADALALGNAALRVDSLALDAARGMTR